MGLLRGLKKRVTSRSDYPFNCHPEVSLQDIPLSYHTPNASLEFLQAGILAMYAPFYADYWGGQ
jgi:hypothetical protein